MKLSLHYLALIGAIALGAFLRFWRLDWKPLWMDEIITALFSLGRTYYDVPLEVLAPFSALEQVFTLNSAATCPQIAQTVSTQSVHPPLFFCIMHQWLSWVGTEQWVWSLRAFPALIGVGMIIATYYLNRAAFSAKAGLIGAAVVAVSPFAVYLSQEARHYTLPMLLITLGVLAIIRIQQRLQQRKSVQLWVWLGWMLVNAIGFYVHYFFLLAFVAQVVTLVGWMGWQRQIISRRAWAAMGLAVTGVVLAYLPWLPTFLSHVGRPETDWLIPYEPSWVHKIAPLYQIPAGWLVMAIALPVEHQPLWVAIPCAIAMVVFTGWLGWHVYQGLKQLWSHPETRLGIFTLGSFILVVLLEFLAIVYILGKDITVVPRYNFTYYPIFAALLAASLVSLPGHEPSSGRGWKRYLTSPQQVQWGVLLAGFVSCVLIGLNLVFQKPYLPQKVARTMILEGDRPLLVVGGYETLFEIALGLSFDLELAKRQITDAPGSPQAYFAFLPRSSPTYAQFWERLSNLSPQPPATAQSGSGDRPLTASLPFQLPLNLWVVGPGLVQELFPPQISLANPTVTGTATPILCPIDPSQHHRIGIPYQLYRCQ